MHSLRQFGSTITVTMVLTSAVWIHNHCHNGCLLPCPRTILCEIKANSTLPTSKQGLVLACCQKDSKLGWPSAWVFALCLSHHPSRGLSLLAVKKIASLDGPHLCVGWSCKGVGVEKGEGNHHDRHKHCRQRFNLPKCVQPCNKTMPLVQ